MRGVQAYKNHIRFLFKGRHRWSVYNKDTGSTIAHGFARSNQEARDLCRSAQVHDLSRNGSKFQTR